MMHENTSTYDPYEDYEPHEVTVGCTRGHGTRKVTVHHPSDEFYCSQCGMRMPGVQIRLDI